MNQSSLPRMIHPLGFDTIEAETIRLEEIATKRGGEAWQTFSRDLQNQMAFMEHFRKTFSVRLSLKFLDLPYSCYAKWRRTSISFVKDYNDAIETWADDIYTSAATRAKGHLQADDSTESGYVEDAEGTPIWHGANDKLSTMFLKAMYPEQFNDKIDMNMSGGLNNTSTPLDKEEYKAVRKAMLKEDDC